MESIATAFRDLRTPKSKIAWPEPHLSIGEQWCIVGKNTCWQAFGPALYLVETLLVPIKILLEARHEDLLTGVCVPRCMCIDLYMIGRSVEKARPTVIFSSESKVQRQRAMKLVRESGLMHRHPAVVLGDVSRPLRLSREPQRLGKTWKEEIMKEELDQWDQQATLDLHPSHESRTVYYSQPITNTCHIPVFVRDLNKTERKIESVLGIIEVGHIQYGLTVAHILESADKEGGPEESDLQLDYESDDQEGIEEKLVAISSSGKSNTYLDIMSRVVAKLCLGSISSTCGSPLDSTSSRSLKSESNHLYSSDPYGGGPPERKHSIPGAPFPTNTKQDYPSATFGTVVAWSTTSGSSNLDWALVALNDIELFSGHTPAQIHHHTINRVVPSLQGTRKVRIMTASKAPIFGSILGAPTYMQMPPSTAFQEVWTVVTTEALCKYILMLLLCTNLGQYQELVVHG